MRALRSNLAAAAATALLLSGTGCGDTNVGGESDIAASTQALAAVPPGTRPNINSLSPSQRTTLANAILAFITPEILDEHSAGHDWHHPSNGELFFIRHHEFTNKLETYLMANGLSQFVPLPYWDPGTTIPSEFLVVDSAGYPVGVESHAEHAASP